MNFSKRKIIIISLITFLIAVILFSFFLIKKENHQISLNKENNLEENRETKNNNSSVQIFFAPQDSINEPLIKAIDQSKKSIDVAVFFFWSPDLFSALERAYNRGAKIRILTDKSEFKRKNSLVSKIERENKFGLKAINGLQNKGIMHFKFAIFDQKEIYIGSYNWLKGPSCPNYENALFLSNPGVINIYQKTFNNIWENKQNIILRTKIETDNSSPMEIFFSPQGGTKDRLIELIGQSKKNIDIAILDFSSSDLIKELIKAKNKGVKVRIITDKWHAFYKNKKITKELINKNFNLKAIRTQEKGMMHHKFVIFDNQALITGSYNWTDQAELWNYENSIIFFDKAIIKKYKEEFDKIWQTN